MPRDLSHIDWSRTDWTKSDGTLAAFYGCCRDKVRKVRKERGIAHYNDLRLERAVERVHAIHSQFEATFHLISTRQIREALAVSLRDTRRAISMAGYPSPSARGLTQPYGLMNWRLPAFDLERIWLTRPGGCHYFRYKFDLDPASWHVSQYRNRADYRVAVIIEDNKKDLFLEMGFQCLGSDAMARVLAQSAEETTTAPTSPRRASSSAPA